MLTGAVLCQLALVFITLSYVYVTKCLVDIATGDTTSMDLFLGPGHPKSDGLWLFAGLMILNVLVRIGLQSIIHYLENKADVRISNKLRQKAFDNILRLRSDFRSKYHSGDIVNRLHTDVNTISSACSTSMPNVIGAVLKFVAAFIYLLTLEPTLAWILVVVIPLGVFGGRYVMLKIRDLTKSVRESDSQIQSHVQESVQHLSIIKTLEYSDESSAELARTHEDFYGKYMHRTRFTIVARVVSSLCFSLAYAVAFLWGVRGIFIGTVTYGLMTAFLQLVSQIQRPLIEMSDQLPTIFHSTASIDRLNELEQLPKEEDSEPVMVDGVAGIRVENLSFTYPDGSEKIFEHFSHDFKPGSRTAVVGETGVGKSTLVKLLLDLLQPDEGSIEIYGSEGGEVPASSAGLCNLVYVPQGNSLFSGTIRKNLLMGKPSATDSDLEEALHTAAADFVFELPKGLDTNCFEAGGGLSEGQAQRIAIARALLHQGTVLLLDEFSSALDAQTEDKLLERLTGAHTGKTMIFITHRERVADFCDNTLRI